MPDFAVIAVRYNQAKTHIEFVKVARLLPGVLGAHRTVPRAFIADLINVGKSTFKTYVPRDGKYYSGADIHVIDDEFITTDPNIRKRDNLENLPEF